ncbi:hypothetical protein BpHYR1_034259 [Brachionus plicatilis]|uniref:Uncharacterized protein n=1 Tax=Brachionus plicatilis TaxID=10195 RepID=A0A3M7R5B5_BRAPC|nr:hypothetical protein BpHYR1_034259 [Brachionus plicatilis]
MHLSLVFVVLIGISVSNAYPEADFAQRDEAMEFLNEKRELDTVKRFFYSGKEQRREVRERYEEKCEGNLLRQALKKPRWCPELDTWPEWRAAEGLSNSQNLKKKLSG